MTILYFISSSSVPNVPNLPMGTNLPSWRHQKDQGVSGGTQSEKVLDTESPSVGETKEESKSETSAESLVPKESASVSSSNPSGTSAGKEAKPSSAKDASSSKDSADAKDASTGKTSASSSSSDADSGPKDGKMNATFVTLARNSDLWDIVDSIRGIEDRFNRNYHYDWVFLNDKPFDETFKKVTSALVSGTTHYGKIPKEHWSFPEWIDQEKAQKVREDMADRKIIYGDSVSYRHMCRFESGFFYRQPLMQNYEWYWRVEPSVKIFCDVGFDPFRFMADNKKKYSFVISLYEYVETIPTIWDSAKKFMSDHPEHIAKDNSMAWLSDDGGESYNHCHFWSNFEVGNLDWLRSQAYTDFFETLDKDGGFFYERWGDAPVHSIAAGLLLNKDEIHFFEDIGYWHVPFTHCPTSEQKRLDLKCHCNPKDNFDWRGYSCKSNSQKMQF